MKTNVLILSAGTRNKIVQYFRENLINPDGTRKGKVVAADMSNLAPAMYEADEFYQVPGIRDEGYLGQILKICEKEQIAGVLSLIDPELSLLAENEKRFRERGVSVIGSPYEVCELCLNKWEMYRWLDLHGYSCAKTYLDQEAFYRDVQRGRSGYPVFVKPVKGSASLSVSKAYDKETVEFLFRHAEEPLLIQEYLDGQEIGADCYVDLLSGKLVSVFTKKKIVMRAGETDKSISFKEEKLFALIKKFVSEAGYRGPIDIDIFDLGGEYYISEVNPRFGGGYPHAYECGANHIEKILKNLRGEINEPDIGNYEDGVSMMKYNEICIKKLR